MFQIPPLPLPKSSGVVSCSQYKSCVAGLGMVAQAFNPSTREAEVDRPL